MKKQILTIIAALMLTGSAYAEVAMGITANVSRVDTSGTQTLRDASTKTSASHEEDVVIPELFLEFQGDSGAIGLAYIPVQELGAKSRTDTESTTGRESGTYKADAEVSNHVMLYTDINLGDLYGSTVYGKAGVALATIKTNESLNAGSKFDNQDVMGITLGLGFKGDGFFGLLGDNYFYKVDLTYTDYEQYKKHSNAGNLVTADTEITSAKFSLGYKF